MNNPNSTVSDFDMSLLMDDTLSTPECKGQIYRASISTFVGEKGDVVSKLVFRPQKRKSCPGCQKCGYLLDDLKESLACDTFIFPNNAEHGKLYKLDIINIDKDYETGIADNWDTTFILLEE